MTEREAGRVLEQIRKVAVLPRMSAFREHVVPDNPHGYSVRVTLPDSSHQVLSTPEQAEAFLRNVRAAEGAPS